MKPTIHIACVRATSIAAALAATVFAAAAQADETAFPARSRTLETTPPATCSSWSAPLPEKRVRVLLPRDVRPRSGTAQVTISIGADGSYGGIVGALTNDEAFVRAAEDSLQYWTFTAARCDGVPVATQARIYFNFREDTFVSYSAINPLP